MTPANHVVSFGPFTLDLATDALWRDGAELPLRPQARKVLRILVAHSGLHLSHEQMMRQAWDNMLVSKHTVTVTVSEVKRILGEYGSWITCNPKLGYCMEIPDSEELLREGWHHLSRRTREGMLRAVQCFEEAAAATGAESRALEGLSRAYLYLGVDGILPSSQIYPKFLEAHERVVKLRGYTAELRVDRGLGLHVFERRFAAAEAQLLDAVREQPKLAVAHVHLAMLYVALHRMEDARRCLRAARQADALGPALALAEILVPFASRDYEAAIAFGRRVLELHPYFPSAMAFYASVLETMGRYEEALEQYRLVCMMTPNVAWHRALEGVCLAKAGRAAQARSVLSHLEWMREKDHVDGYHLGLLYHALGRTDDAFRELERAYKEDCPALTMLDADPKMDPLRGDPRFLILRDKLFGSGAAVAS